MSMNDKFAQLEARLGYNFSDRDLVREAFTHASRTNECPEEKSSERLEYLGDAVVELLISGQLFLRHPTWQEGQMTRARASVVSEASLSEAARKLGLGEFIIMSRGTEQVGGRERPSILCDIFEALSGAIYLDGGMQAVEKIILPCLEEGLSQVASGQILKDDYKTLLQEQLQRNGQVDIQYKLLHTSGPAHERSFVVALEVDGKRLTEGQGHSKKAAQQMAAKKAMKFTPIRGDQFETEET